MGSGSTDSLFRSTLNSPSDAYNGMGQRPFVFDILAPDGQTSVLPYGYKMVLHVNPQQVHLTYTKTIERIQTKGGFVEQHWGEGAGSMSFDMVTGGFKRLYSGMSNITGGGLDVGGTRRETLAYDKYLDLLALFYNNGSIYDASGQIVFQGYIRITFDKGVYIGWFESFSIEESASSPYQFSLSGSFVLAHEVLTFHTTPYGYDDLSIVPGVGVPRNTADPTGGGF